VETKIPKSYFVFFFVIGIMLASRPLWIDVTIPVLPLVAIFMAGGYVASIYSIVYLRKNSPVVLIDSGVRESASLLKPLVSSSSMGGDFPPMVTFNVGGAAAMQAGYPNKNIVHVPKETVEWLNREKAVLIYSPAQPIDGRLMEGVAGADFDIALKAAHSGFLPKSAFVYFSFLNSLRGEDTEEMKRAIDSAITKYAGPASEDRRRARLAGGAFIADLRAIQTAGNKKKPKDKITSFFMPQQAKEMQEQQDTLKQRAQ